MYLKKNLLVLWNLHMFIREHFKMQTGIKNKHANCNPNIQRLLRALSWP